MGRIKVKPTIPAKANERKEYKEMKLIWLMDMVMFVLHRYCLWGSLDVIFFWNNIPNTPLEN